MSELTVKDLDAMLTRREGEIAALRRLLTAATERAEKAESQRDRMSEALHWIAEEANTGESGDAYEMKRYAAEALKEVGDE